LLSPDAFLGLIKSQKCAGGRSSALDPAGGAYSTPPDTLAKFHAAAGKEKAGKKKKGTGDVERAGTRGIEDGGIRKVEEEGKEEVCTKGRKG